MTRKAGPNGPGTHAVSTTSTTRGAQEHARAQAASLVEYGPTIPAAGAHDLPPGIDPATALWAETVAPGGYAARVLPRGTILRIVDVDGDACANLLVFSARRPTERLNVADTVKVQWQAYLAEGALLLSDMGRVLLSIVTDTTGGRHDALCGVSTLTANVAKYGSGDVSGPHPNGRDRFAVAIAKYGLERRDIAPSVNLFKHVRVAPDGGLHFDTTPGIPGGTVELRAEQAVLVVVADTPHVLDPRPEYTVTALRITAWAGSATGPDDPLWRATPEGERAFRNTEDALLEGGLDV